MADRTINPMDETGPLKILHYVIIDQYEIAGKYGCRYIDCNEALVDEHGEQKSEYAIDGVHMYANGYLNVFKSLKPYL